MKEPDFPENLIILDSGPTYGKSEAIMDLFHKTNPKGQVLIIGPSEESINGLTQIARSSGIKYAIQILDNMQKVDEERLQDSTKILHTMFEPCLNHLKYVKIDPVRSEYFYGKHTIQKKDRPFSNRKKKRRK